MFCLAMCVAHSFVLGACASAAVARCRPGAPKPGNSKAAISGTVTDRLRPVTGAKVVLTNTAGFKQETQTDEKGAYSFTGLDAGPTA